MVAKSRLKAVAPKAAEPSKPKVLVFGAPGVGKTWASLSWPSVYFIDSEGGANLDHYTDRLAAAGGVYLGPAEGATSFEAIIEQVQALATEAHPYRTLVIDSISKTFNMEIAREAERLGDKDQYGASKKPALRALKRLVGWLDRLDMNVILIAHEKDVWGDSGKVGVTFDCDPKLEYELHLCLHIRKQGGSRLASVRKSRLTQFPDGTSFPWSFDDFADRYGRHVIEAAAKPVELITPEQASEMRRLLDAVRMPDGWLDKCLTAAGVETIEELDADKAAKMLNALTERKAA